MHSGLVFTLSSSQCNPILIDFFPVGFKPTTLILTDDLVLSQEAIVVDDAVGIEVEQHGPERGEGSWNGVAA